MADGGGFGSLFKRATKWAKDDLASSLRLGGESRDEREAHDDERRAIERDATEQRDKAIVDALTPQGLKDFQASRSAARAEQQTAAEARARADRAARAGESSAAFSGRLSGRADHLAVDVTFVPEDSSLHVVVEPVDPVPLGVATLSGFCFAVPGYHGDGSYVLVDSPEFDGMQYEVYLLEENEGWAFHPSYGPGSITIAADVATVHLTVGSVGDGDIATIDAIIHLPAVAT